METGGIRPDGTSYALGDVVVLPLHRVDEVHQDNERTDVVKVVVPGIQLCPIQLWPT